MAKGRGNKYCDEFYREVNNLKKITLRKSGLTNISPGCPQEPKEETEALIWHTDHGFKIIPLTPDVRKVYLEITTLCNFDCTTCIRNSWEDRLGKMSASVFENIVKQLKELPELECVHFGGFGEPMSHPDFFSMVKTIKELGVGVELITNGSLLTPENAAKLIDFGLDRLFISLDGPDPETYHDVRKGADYTSVIDNIQSFNQLKKERKVNGPQLVIEFVAMKSNFHKLPELVRMLGELQAQYMLVTNVLPYCEEMKDEILYDLDDTVPLFDKVSGLIMLRAQLPNMRLRTQRSCKFVEDKAMVITSDGNVAPCYALMHSYKCYIYGREKKIHPYHLGNVLDKPLTEIWANPNYAYFRMLLNDFHFPSCTDCRLLEGCTMADDNVMDCWGNSPSCADCLWARGLIVCP